MINIRTWTIRPYGSSADTTHGESQVDLETDPNSASLAGSGG